MIPLLDASSVPAQAPARSEVTPAGAEGTEELLGALLGVPDEERPRLMALVRRWHEVTPEVRAAVLRVAGVPA
jgi:hypothetical protein